MKLDSRILEGKKPLTCFDTEQAKEFLGKECYFSNCKVHYKNLSAFEKYVTLTDYCIGTLTAVMDLGDRVFDVDQQCKEFRYCLPCEWVKPEEPEKKYRPLSFKEFRRLFDVGDGVCFRRKGQDTAEFSMYLGYEIDSDGNRDEIPGEGKVNLGGNRYTLAELFEYYEMQLDGEWQPFGVEVEE